MRGSQGGVHPPADFSTPAGGFSFGFFWRIFPLYFATKKNPPQNPPQNRGEFLFQKSPGLEAPEIHRPPPPPRESKSNSCAFGSGTVTFQGGSFQEKTPGLIGPRSLRILIGRIAVGWPCMECHVPCHISIYWVWDSVKQSEGWGKNPALIARSPTRHSKFLLKKFITNRLCWFGSLIQKGFWEKGYLRTIWFSCAYVPLLLLPVAALQALVFKCDARNGPLLHHTRFQNPAPLHPSMDRT